MGTADSQDLVHRLQERARIRKTIATRKSVQEGKPDRLADLLEEAATEIIQLQSKARGLETNGPIIDDLIGLEKLARQTAEHKVAKLQSLLREAKAWIKSGGHGPCARDMDWHQGPECDLPGAKHPRSKCDCGYEDLLARLRDN